MNAKRAETSTVGISLRLREDLRRNLEEAAHAKRTSLNQEVIERCEHVRDRQSLLMETMSLGYGRDLAAILLVVGAVMRTKGWAIAEAGIRKEGWVIAPGDDWIDYAEVYEEAMKAAVTALEALRPGGAAPKSLDRAFLDQVAREVHRLAGPYRPDRITRFFSQVEARMKRQT